MDNRQVQLERSNHVLTAMGVDTRNAKVMDRTQYLTFDGKGKSSVVLLIDSNTVVNCFQIRNFVISNN